MSHAQSLLFPCLTSPAHLTPRHERLFGRVAEKKTLLHIKLGFTLVLNLRQRRFILCKSDWSSEELETLRRSMNPTMKSNGLWKSANKRGSTSFRSRFWPIRECANLVVPGLSSSSGTSSSSTSTAQDLSSSRPVAERRDEPAPGNWSETNPKTKIKEETQSRFGRPCAKSYWAVGRFHRQSRGHTNVCSRTQFSWLRFGTTEKTSQETEESLRQFFEPSQKPEVTCTDNPLEFSKS